MSQPERFESEKVAARVVEVPVSGRSRRETVTVCVVLRADGEAASAQAPEDATLAA